MSIKQEAPTQRLALHHLTLKPELQARELKPSVVNKYFEAMQRGEEFPPITVVRDGKDHYYLVDGHHRVAASRQLVGIDDIAIKIIPGTFADALWLSWGVNRDHGLPRTQKAKRNAIRAALRHPKWSKESDRAIAKHIGCDHKTVGYMRRWIRSGEFPTPGAAVALETAPSKKAILKASLLLARVQPTQESDFAPDELAIVRKGYEAVDSLLGVKTLPSEPLKIKKRLKKVKKQNTNTKLQEGEMISKPMAERIEFYDIDRLIPSARNARTHSEAQIAEIAGSIVAFGFIVPVLVDADGGIIAGYGRVLAARKLNLQRVPVIVATHLTETEKRAYAIADNKIALNAGWDEQLLKVEIEALKNDGVNLDTLGFSEDEFNELLDNLGSEQQPDEDSTPESPVTPVTVSGDVWRLGDHVLLCGDALDEVAGGQTRRHDFHRSSL